MLYTYILFYQKLITKMKFFLHEIIYRDTNPYNYISKNVAMNIKYEKTDTNENSNLLKLISLIIAMLLLSLLDYH